MQISQSQLNLASELLFREQEIIEQELWRKTNIEDDLDRKNQQHKKDLQIVTEKIAAGEDIQAQGQRLLRIQRLQEGYSRILQTKQEEEEKEHAQTDQLFDSFKSALARRKQKAAKLLAESEECCQMFQKQREDKENVRPILQQPLDIFHDCETIPASDYFVSKAEISEAEEKGHGSALSLLHKTARALKANAIESVKEQHQRLHSEGAMITHSKSGNDPVAKESPLSQSKRRELRIFHPSSHVGKASFKKFQVVGKQCGYSLIEVNFAFALLWFAFCFTLRLF